MMHSVAAAGSAEAVAGIVLADLALILAAAAALGKLAERLRQPAVIGEIVAGLALGPALLGLIPGATDLLLPAQARPYLQVLAQLGLVLFMFGVGYHFDLRGLRGSGRQVTAVSLTSVALPFVLGAGLAVALHPWFDTSQMSTDGLLGPVLFLGAAMSITAFPVLARIITERGLQKERIGNVALACAAIQDVLAWGILAAVVAVVHAEGGGPPVRMVLTTAAFGLLLVRGVRPALAWLLSPRRRWAGSAALVHAVLVTGLLLSAWATHSIGLHAVFGAFAFGAVVPRRQIDAAAPEVPERIEQTSLLLLPVFFTVTGLSVDLAGLGTRGFLMLVAVTAVACVGKFVGAAGAARLTGSGAREATALGVLLNTRGLTELVILNVGLGLGVLDTRLFTAMVCMALITTVMAGPLLRLTHPPAPRPKTVPAVRPVPVTAATEQSEN
ncbi:cation:proton antiporter [Streptomyces sp. NPDC001514]